MKIQFYLRFRTSFGQTLWISDNSGELGTDIIKDAIPMSYLNEDFWEATINVENESVNAFNYKYLLKNEDGEVIPEWGDDRVIQVKKEAAKELYIIDTWNHAGEFENVFYTAPFAGVLLKQKHADPDSKKPKEYTHVFKVKAPLIGKNEAICLLGAGRRLGNWATENIILLSKEGNWWTAYVDLSEEDFPIAYKYGVYNTSHKEFSRYEKDDNRLLYGDSGNKKRTILHDGFANLPNNTWKGAGVAIPVFSLRSKKSFGIGEFADLKQLVDWAKECSFRLIQILPVNDTIATHTWKDTYPYAAISAFALHPCYINLEKVAGKKYADILNPYIKKRKKLNALPEVDYEAVMKIKLAALKDIYTVAGKVDLATDGFKKFFNRNSHWLIPYAAFCFLRDDYGSSHFEEWPANTVYDKKDIDLLTSKNSKTYPAVAFYYFVQYHLHLQLKDAADYAHKKGIILKGDIPIGVYRYGCDAWVAPHLYNMSQQAGAPPDDFAIKGQNWGFPTYNWKRMQDDHFDWWRKRFEQMSHYFDAFRIDHILGFFRIWSIPMHAVEGIMGYFVPAIPVSINEFSERGIWFDYHRYCKPFITDEILKEIFADLAEQVKTEFLIANEYGSYDLEMAFDTQRKIEEHFLHEEKNDANERLKQGLFDLISNVILFADENLPDDQFHFRISMESISSYKSLEWDTQQKLKALYIDYFFRRQERFWMKEAMHKLPYLKRATNMLACGEDLGMVPECVPDVMMQLGILSLEIQRMPKEIGKEFSHPADAPYLSVITPSTHDMSTIRGWWEEDAEKSANFFNNELGQWGKAPLHCEDWINRAIVIQHLYSPAMWSIFMLQDLLGMSNKLRRENPEEERINVPANPNHHWRYRMHLFIEDLIKESEFNKELRGYIENSGR